MPNLRTPLAVALLLAGLAARPALAAGHEPVPLNDHTRLGQCFTATQPLVAVAVTVPSWSDNEGGLTLVLWDSPERTRELGRVVVTGVVDNAPVEIALAQPAPAGRYYWEVSERTGQTRIGLYCDLLDAETDDCAYLDGKADRKRRFLFGTTAAPMPWLTSEQAVAILRSSAPLADRADACRQLALVGGREAVPALAALLGDEALSHLARLALEPIPDAAADEALRQALGTLRGKLLVGAMNSIGERRDPAAVDALGQCLADPDPAVAAAAAAALGRIATPAAAAQLLNRLGAVGTELSPPLGEALLDCGARLTAANQPVEALALYAKLDQAGVPLVTRVAARGGTLVARGVAGVPLLLEQLRGDDPAMAAVALWVAQHELPGEEVTRALAAAVSGLPEARQVDLVRALASRDDPAVAPALTAAAQAGPKNARLAAISGLVRRRAEPVTTALLALALDADADLATAARTALENRSGQETDTEVVALLRSPQRERRLLAFRLAAVRRTAGALPVALETLGDPDAEIRLAAMEALAKLAGPAELDPLLARLGQAPAGPETQALERALAAACAKAPDREACAARLADLVAPAADNDRRLLLLRLLHGLGGTRARQAVLATARQADGDLRTAAVRLLGDWKTPEIAPDLLQFAESATDPAAALLCLRGALRLAATKDLPADQRLALCRQAVPRVQRVEEKKLLLAALSGLALPEALALLTPYLEADETRAEAAAAVLSVAEPLAATPQAAQTVAPLEAVVRLAPGTDPARRAEALLAKLRPPPVAPKP